MVIGTSGSFYDDNRAENDARDATMKGIDGTVDKSDSVDEEKTSPPNDQDNGVRSKSLPSPENDENESNNQSDSDSSDGTSSGDDSGSDSDSDSDGHKPGDGISAYERLRIERIRRNEERLKQLGLVDPSKKLVPPKRKKRISVGGANQKRSKERHMPKRSQPKRSAKENLMQGGLLSGGQIDLRRSWPLRQSYKDRFGSQKKTKAIPDKNRYSKRYHCGECRACKRQDDCQTCCFCSFNSRQGNSSTCRRRCLFKMCLRRLVDVEVEVEEEKGSTEAEALAKENGAEASTEIDKTIEEEHATEGVRNDDAGGHVDKDNAAVPEKIDTHVDTKIDGDDQVRKEISQLPKSDTNVEQSTKDSACAEEKGQSVKAEDMAREKVPIENSEYFASYRMDESESGLPKWLDEFHEFMATIPHGPMNRVSGQKNADNTMSQVCKLVTGEGVTYHLWPEGTHFKKGIKIHLGMNLSALHLEAIAMERRYEDRRKGSLLRHPIAKMICYKEWISNGKPTASKESPMSPLLALPPPKIDNNKVNKDGNNKSKAKKRIIAMTIEQRIKPNRISWASDVVIKAKDVGSSTTALTVKNEAGNVADINISQGDDKENKKELLSYKNDGKKTYNTNEKDAVNDAIDEATGREIDARKAENEASITKEVICRDDVATKASSDSIVDTDNQPDSNGEINAMPRACSFCSGDGDLICCDGCNRGFHSNCHFPKIKEMPMGEWFCKDCTRKKTPQWSRRKSGPKRKVIFNDKLFQGEHDDNCYICYLGGELICCDFCQKAYHLECHIPPLPFVPEGIWKCCECMAVERTKKSRCGECEACTRDDCGQCKHCLDKPKFGGFSKLRQVCIKKVCPYPRFAPPTSSEQSLVPGTFRKRGRPRKSLNDNIPIIGSGRKRGRPRKSVDNENLTIIETKRKRGRPRKSVDDNFSTVTSGSVATIIKKKRGRPRKSADGNNLGGDGSPGAAIIKKKRGRPRKSADGNNLGGDPCPIATTAKRKRGRPRKSLDADTVLMNNRPVASATKKKCGRPRKSIDSGEMHKSKRLKVEADDEKSIIEPIVFRFKISSFKSAYTDPESIKIRKIVKSALRDPSDSKTVDKACERLRNCMKSVESVKTAMLFGGVEMLCNAMRDHPDKSILQAEACCTLAEMLWVFPAISTKLAHMNAINLIVTSIHRCSNNSKVQQMGCGVLGAFSYDENFTKHILDAGGLQAVEAAMERFPKKVAVLMEGCYFFQNLIARSIDALRSVSNSQVVPIIVETLSTEDLDKGILLPMFGLISNLAVDKEAKELIGQSDAIYATISALNAEYDLELKQAACTVLKNLAMGSSDNQTKIAESGGLEALFSVMNSYPDDELFLILSFNVMKELCMNDDEIAYEIVKNGGIKIILKAMQNNNDLATMQIAACQIIGYLLLEGKSEIHAPKLVKAILTAMKDHSEDSDVQIQACDALFELSQISTTRLILKKKETQGLLLRAKSRFKSCESDVDDIIAASRK